MKLQLALDLVNIPEGISIVREVEAYVDVVEIGTPVVINEGLRAVKEMKDAFPNLTVLADLKIMDIVTHWPGSSHDSNTSTKYKHYKDTEIQERT